jgi:hypothetical protein
MAPFVRPTSLIIDIFIIVNLSFLALDIFIAHSTNEFSRSAEWIPFYFSLIAPIFLGIESWRNWSNKQRKTQLISIVIGSISIIIGVAGLIWHLHSSFFEYYTLKSLVYTAPFIAPLAYAGLGALLIMNRMVDQESMEWGEWLIFLALGGFFGNFILALSDHSQNGFFIIYEWIPVISSAIAVSFLGVTLTQKYSIQFTNISILIMILQIFIGVWGFYFHCMTVLHSDAPGYFEKIVYNAPIFAPLLFVNLAILSLFGLIDLRYKIID